MTIHKHNSDLLLKGTFISIDPSSGSNSSMPAYAVYKEGRLVASGKLEVDINKELLYRLAEIRASIEEVLKEYPDIKTAVIENIPVMPGRFNHKSLSSLMKSVGAVAAAFNPLDIYFIEIHPKTWQKFAPKDYIKSDVGDAIMIGRAAIKLAEEISKDVKKSKRIKT